MSSWADFSQYLFSGLSAGCVYALVALAFVTIANVTGVFNFAQGEYVMVGGMVMAAVYRAGWGFAVGVLLAMLAVAGVALVQERATVAPVRTRVSPLGLVVASLGFGVLLRGVALWIWGKDPLSVPSFEPGTFEILGARLDNQAAWVWGTTAVGLIALLVLFQLTAIGRAMRACAINPMAARLLGIRVGTMSMVAFVLAGLLSGLVGAVVVPLTLVSWQSGLTIGLVGFIAAALADFEKPNRAVVAGLALGVIESVAAGVISSEYRTAIVYGVLIAYLVGKDLMGADGILRRLVKQRATAAGWRVARRARSASLAAVAAVVAERERRRFAWEGLIPLVALGLSALTPIVLSSNPEALDAAIFIVLSAIGATGLVLVMGLARQFSLGQAAFYLVSGYAAAILTAKHGWNPLAAIATATALSIAGGFLVGWLTLRLRGFNLAIATLAIHLILLVVVLEQENLTGGALGMVGIPQFELFGLNLWEPERFFWVALVVLAACLLVARNLTRSRLGRSLRAVGADEEGAQSLAVNAFRLKLVVFVVGAGMAGVAGSLWAFYLQYAAPSTWDFNLTISLVTYVIVGGVSSIYGGAVGALAIGWLQYWVRHSFATSFGGGSTEYEIVMNGALIVVFVLLFRDGLAVALSVDRLRDTARRLAAAVRGRPATVLAPATSVEQPQRALDEAPSGRPPTGRVP